MEAYKSQLYAFWQIRVQDDRLSERTLGVVVWQVKKPASNLFFLDNMEHSLDAHIMLRLRSTVLRFHYLVLSMRLSETLSVNFMLPKCHNPIRERLFDDGD